jgi:hypothetical protein
MIPPQLIAPALGAAAVLAAFGGFALRRYDPAG